MGRTLIIVESPAKAKTIERFLGRRYKVQASMGHIRDLPKSQFGVDIEADFEPKYITIRGKGQIVSRLRQEAKKFDRVLLATDPDREGEAIAWHLTEALDLPADEPNRIVFREITRDAVRSGVEQPRTIDRRLVDAQQSRRILDRIVGYKLSPFLWRKVRRGLSAGRVQSVAVRLICDREAEINAFQPEEYWSLTAVLSPAGRPETRFEARYHGPAGQGETPRAGDGASESRGADRHPIKSKDDMHQLLASLHGAGYRVVDVRRRERRRNPAPPFTTSTLQQEAARKLGFTARRTMRTAQQLYEGLEIQGEGTVGLITYMRTDSTRVAPQAVAEAAGLIRQRYGEAFSAPKAFGKQREGAQDAHEAIRPTSAARLPDDIKADLTSDQYRLYRLIWERFLASQMSPAVYDTVTADIRAGDHLFRATGSTLKFAGFTILYIEGRDDEESDDEGALPPLEADQVLELHDLVPRQHFTQPPPRYTEAMLVKALEEHGIGRPSTYAPIIETIQERGYVTREDRRFKPTELGTAVTELLKEHFPDIVDIEFTARMEDELDRIEEGQRAWREVLGEFYEGFEPMLARAEREAGRVELAVEETDEPCEVCGRKLVIKHGRYGPFLACPGYPECRFTKPLLEKTGASCPECGGEVVVRRSRKGRTFYGCANYPECRFVAWYKPTSRSCPKCGAFLMERRTRARGAYLQCSREACGHTEDAPAASQRPAAAEGAGQAMANSRRRSAPSAAEQEMAQVAGDVVRAGERQPVDVD